MNRSQILDAAYVCVGMHAFVLSWAHTDWPWIASSTAWLVYLYWRSPK